MQELIIYHNGICSKSKGALELLQEQNIPHTIRWYLTDPLTKEELQKLLTKLSLKPSEIVRRNEPLFKEKFEGKEIQESEWIELLISHPELIERPIVENASMAVVARPAEKLLELL